MRFSVEFLHGISIEVGWFFYFSVPSYSSPLILLILLSILPLKPFSFFFDSCPLFIFAFIFHLFIVIYFFMITVFFSFRFALNILTTRSKKQLTSSQTSISRGNQ